MDNLLKIANIKEMLINSAEKYGDNVAYKIDDKNITYKEVKNNVDSLGTALINKGLQGKRIAVIGQNSYNWEIAYLSIVCGTGVVVPLDKMLPEKELESLIKRSEVEAIFFDEKFEEVLEKISKKNDNNLKLLISMGERKKEKTLLQKDLIETGKQLVLNGNKEFINSKINDDKMNILLFTSGTTSKSKAVMLSHKNICSNIDAIGKTLNVDENDSFLSILPLHHVFECTVGFLFPLSVGARIVFGRGLKHIAQDLKDNQISVLLCVPAIYENLYKNIRKKFEKEGHLELLEELEEKAQNYSMQERRKIFKQIHESIDNNTKLLISGAAALDPEVEKTFRIWGFNLVQGYGLTEASPVISVESEENYRLSSIGKALPGIEAKIDNPDIDGMGELIVKGDNVMLGYLNDDEATKKVIKDGWLYTGDLAKIDEDGFIYICGRKKSVIVLKNGKNIFPEEMEKLVNKIEGVRESFIFGKTTNKTKGDIKLNVEIVYDKNEVQDIYKITTIDEIYEKFHEKIKQVNSTIPSYKAIKGIVFSEEPLIKTSTNKIKRDENIARINRVSV
ncbi:MAG: AMP-binding protein [Clostridia bacterium]|nr:AMP-binding protein [Clostridia bacterium]